MERSEIIVQTNEGAMLLARKVLDYLATDVAFKELTHGDMVLVLGCAIFYLGSVSGFKPSGNEKEIDVK